MIYDLFWPTQLALTNKKMKTITLTISNLKSIEKLNNGKLYLGSQQTQTMCKIKKGKY